MEQEFNRQKLAENIMALMKQKKLKIGEVEQQIGISTGYLSKMLKKDTDAAPSTDIIWKLAKVLGVSTDMLIEGDFTKVMDNIHYLANFFTKLKIMTDGNELEWKSIPISKINECLLRGEPIYPIILEHPQSKEEIEIPSLPIFRMGNEVSLSGYGQYHIGTKGIAVDAAWITGSGFYTRFNQKTDVYIFPMGCSFTVDEDGNSVDTEYYDVYFGLQFPPDDFDGSYTLQEEEYHYGYEQVCSTFTNEALPLQTVIQTLYQSIAAHEYDLRITSNVRHYIDTFMNPDGEGR